VFRPDARTRGQLSALVAEPSRTVVVTDFDGTLSPIVDDPTTARPLDGVVGVLGRLASTFATVAVVSGRPASFLLDRLGTATRDPAGFRELRLFGLYGMESVGPDGSVRLVEEATTWLPVITEVASSLRAHAPPGVLVEVKGAATTVHWRLAPGAEGQVAEQVAELVATSGLVAHPGRRSVELRPPLAVDKGTVLGGIAAGHGAACFLGDDLGDLPAFVELSRLRDEGLATVGVAVIDSDTAPEVTAAADLTVAGPPGALALLEWLADATDGDDGDDGDDATDATDGDAGAEPG
jgi:trehalose 6-phosphate phosphatase